jgi:branched-subunit amino acid ABC-type transport system permease component
MDWQIFGILMRDGIASGAIHALLALALVTTVFYDSRFLIGLKGFVAAIAGGLGSYPLGLKRCTCRSGCESQSGDGKS